MKFLPVFLLLAVFSFAHTDAYSQSKPVHIPVLDSTCGCSIRGLSVPGNEVIWASGSKGHVGRSTNSGRAWRWTVVAGFEKTDFRDIHAFDSLNAVIMGIDNPARILKTRDGGQTWKTVFAKDTAGMFLDAMDFDSDGNGICIGDPVPMADGSRRFYLIRSYDRGDSWQELPAEQRPVAQEGEAVFSASGSNIALVRRHTSDYAFISGGSVSNFYFVSSAGGGSRVTPLPLVKGRESGGAFSMAVVDPRREIYCVGGDYKSPDSSRGSFCRTNDGGKTWDAARSTPSGYRSCIARLDGRRMVACGTNGIDMYNGSVWQRISDASFNVCAATPDGSRIYFAGSRGRIGMLRLR